MIFSKNSGRKGPLTKFVHALGLNAGRLTNEQELAIKEFSQTVSNVIASEIKAQVPTQEAMQAMVENKITECLNSELILKHVGNTISRDDLKDMVTKEMLKNAVTKQDFEETKTSFLNKVQSFFFGSSQKSIARLSKHRSN